MNFTSYTTPRGEAAKFIEEVNLKVRDIKSLNNPYSNN